MRGSRKWHLHRGEMSLYHGTKACCSCLTRKGSVKMYENVLVVTDNLSICKRVSEVLRESHFENVDWSFAVSPSSKIEEFEAAVSRGFFCVNMKDANHVGGVIARFDLVISIHCKQLFPASLVNSVKCINVHPGYNPINRGWFPQVFSIVHDLPVGATIHEIDEMLDHGKIIDRAFVEKAEFEDSLSLYEKIVELEIELLKKNLPGILSGAYASVFPEAEGNLFLKKDFEALCKIDLDEKATYREVIKRLLALTHGEFRNAWIEDAKTGKKRYVTIKIESE